MSTLFGSSCVSKEMIPISTHPSSAYINLRRRPQQLGVVTSTARRSMEDLCGPESLQAVCRRFSDGVDVAKCVLGFIKEVGETEQVYSIALEKLVHNHHYNFHSNFLVQLMGRNPYEEIGSVKQMWLELGSQVTLLAKFHADKACAYLEEVRRPLQELFPKLEETRKEVKNRTRQLKTELEVSASKHSKERQKYQQVAENVEKCCSKVSSCGGTDLNKYQDKLKTLVRELSVQESVYREAHLRHVEQHATFHRDARKLYQMIHAVETDRVNTIKTCIQEFTRTLSNTAPVYLESMQHMMVSVQQVDSARDIALFVETVRQQLSGESDVPHLQLHTLPDQEIFTSTRATAGSDNEDQSNDTSDATPSTSTEPFTERTEEEEEEEEEIGVTRRDLSTGQGVISPVRKERGSGDKEIFPTTQLSLPVKSVGILPKKPQKPYKNPDLLKRRIITTTASTTASTNTIPSTIAAAFINNKRPASWYKYPSSLPEATFGDSTSTSSIVNRTLTSQHKQHQPCQEGDHTQPHTTPSRLPNNVCTTSNGPNLVSSSFSSPIPVLPVVISTPLIPSSGKPKTKPIPHHKLHHHHYQPAGGETLTPAGGEEDRAETPEGGKLHELQTMATANDYYQLLGVEPDANEGELAKARRDRYQELHPDHFVDDLQRTRAVKKLELINNIYQNLLKESETRLAYNTLCQFRKKYPKILEQKGSGLEKAKGNLTKLRSTLKRAQCPLALQEEVTTALVLIETRLHILKSSC